MREIWIKISMRYVVLILSGLFITGNSFSQNVGIGTTTPISKLTVQTPLNTTGFTHIGGTDEIIVQEAIGGVSASIGTITNHAFRLQSNNTGRLSIYPAGQVVVGPNSFGAISQLTVGTSPGNYGITHSDGTITLSTFTGGTQPFAYIGTQSNHALSFYTNNSASQAILLPNGNFGIGTTTPLQKLEVIGSARITGDTRIDGFGDFLGTVGIGTPASGLTGLTILKDNEAIRINGNQSFITFYNSTDYKGYLWNKGADDMELGTAGVNTNGKLLLSIKGTPFLSLQSNGQVSVAGAPAPYKSPAFTVAGNGILSLASIGSEWTIEPLNCGGPPSGPCLLFYAGGFVRSRVDAAGDWVALSDISVKDEVKAYKPVLENIKKLDVSTYHYKHNNTGTRSFGLIAQNVAEYFPEIVSEFPGRDGNTLLGIAYSKTGVLALKAIQEQQEIIEALQTKIDRLEKKLESLDKSIHQKL
jgi:hypothetical protein